MLLIADALTVVYLRPYLLANGFTDAEVDNIVVWYDPSQVATRNDRAADADSGFEKMAISYETWRRAHGFAETEAPTPKEVALRLIFEKGAVTPELTAQIIESLAPEIMQKVREANQAQSVAPIPENLEQALNPSEEAPQPETPTEPSTPPAQEEAPQIRIEHYRDSDTYVVYLGGTIDPGTDPTSEPWDMTSNLSAMAQMDAGSYRATHDAMRQAGIDAQDNVIMVGHSQGGLVAALIAQSGEFQVRDVVTVGAPIRHIELPPDVHVVALEHREDVIPSLSGVAAVGTATHTVVTRSLYAHTPPPQGQVLPAHNLSRYIDTAALLDKNTHGDTRTTQERIATLTRGDATVTMWRANRVSG
jgi:pimeloyl-ACP methyl ester carboxylesterase